MRKTKIERRAENAINAFFDDENPTENNLSFAVNSAVSKAATMTFSQKANQLFAIFKKAFLFLPGVLILHFASLATVYFYNDLGLNIWTLFWFAAGIFMTWAGIGDLKNKKHSLIPLSVIAIALAVAGLIFNLAPQSFELSFYLFPLLFTAPLLIKSLIDELGEEDFDV